MSQPENDHHDDAGVTVLDARRVMEDMEIDAEGYAELVAVFLEEVAPMRDAVTRSLSTGRESFIKVCHEFGTTLGVVGALRGERFARRLERALRADQPVDLAVAAASLLRELEVAAGLVTGGVSRAWQSRLEPRDDPITAGSR